MFFNFIYDFKNYKYAGLEELIPKPDNSHRYWFKDNILFFLLCLLDAIEPIKRFEGEDSYDILKSINFEFDAARNTLSISISKTLKTDEYFENLSCLEKWLQVEVDKKKENE